jgi:1-deoxy-D-xylulose-5-phosphate synthase
MHELLSRVVGQADLQELKLSQLEDLAAQIRDTLCNLVSSRSAHFASNLGVVELCIALHSTFDFKHDRLIWDTGHQIYPHKLITGRYRQFGTIRTKGGLMGYPNPAESPYDLFMTGHAGCSLSTVMGLRSGDQLLGQKDRYAVAVIGDGALTSGIVFEAMNNLWRVENKLLVILNDNKMSICPRVGGMGQYLDRLRSAPFYTGLKEEVVRILNKVPLLGDPVERFLAQLKEGVKAGLHGGMMFEDLGFRYIGPVDGHNISLLRKYLKMVKDLEAPVLLHVVTEKGHGFQPAAADPVYFHTPPALGPPRGGAKPAQGDVGAAYTQHARDAVLRQMDRNPRVTVLTAAMCQGNKLEPVRDQFPDRFFDTGICESHTVAFAAGQAKAGLRPIVDIYSTFLQRSFDQIFQEVALQNLPVTFLLDRAGLTGPDGPTHHGVFDLAYLRILPNLVVMAPGDAEDFRAMLGLALEHHAPCCIRYPKDIAVTIDRPRVPLQLGRAEVLGIGQDVTIIACGATLPECLAAAETLQEQGLDAGVINARFVKPLDGQSILRAVGQSAAVVTVEEAALVGGFGSAVLEAVSDSGLGVHGIRRLGVPDQFVEHGSRIQLLADLGLDGPGIARACHAAVRQQQPA